MNNDTVISMRGEYRDIITRADGTIEDLGWSPNQIQNTNASLIAGFMKGLVGLSHTSNPLYMALGQGATSWDSSPPAKPYSNTQLTGECYREVILSSQISFRDPSTFALDSLVTPTNVMEFDFTIDTSEANGNALREFGLFGGNATATINSGYMINWITHSRIDKDSSISIQRTVRFTFAVS